MITHKTSTIAVFQSNDYGVFGMMKGNRALNQNKIKSIIKEIKGGNDMLPYYPIQVRSEGDKLTILDGQANFKDYIINLEQIANVNKKIRVIIA